MVVSEESIASCATSLPGIACLAFAHDLRAQLAIDRRGLPLPLPRQRGEGWGEGLCSIRRCRPLPLTAQRGEGWVRDCARSAAAVHSLSPPSGERAGVRGCARSAAAPPTPSRRRAGRGLGEGLALSVRRCCPLPLPASGERAGVRGCSRSAVAFHSLSLRSGERVGVRGLIFLTRPAPTAPESPHAQPACFRCAARPRCSVRRR